MHLGLNAVPILLPDWRTQVEFHSRALGIPLAFTLRKRGGPNSIRPTRVSPSNPSNTESEESAERIRYFLSSSLEVKDMYSTHPALLFWRADFRGPCKKHTREGIPARFKDLDKNGVTFARAEAPASSSVVLPRSDRYRTTYIPDSRLVREWPFNST